MDRNTRLRKGQISSDSVEPSDLDALNSPSAGQVPALGSGGQFEWVDQTGGSTLITVNPQTDDYTLVLTDKDKLIDMNKATALTLTIPKNSVVAFEIGTKIAMRQKGTGALSVAPVDGDVTINESNGLTLTAQYSVAWLIKVATDTWTLYGELGTTGLGDMLKSTYDTDDDGIVDKAENVDDGASGGIHASTAEQVKDAVDKKHASGSDDQTATTVPTADSGISVQDALDALETDQHTHSNKAQLDLVSDGDHDVRTDNPHSVTKTQVGLGNVTNDAQLKENISSYSEKVTPADDDLLILEDSEESGTPIKKVKKSNIVPAVDNYTIINDSGVLKIADRIELNLLLNFFRDSVNAGSVKYNLVDGFIDEFEDESGIDTSASTNEDYDSSNDLYKPLQLSQLLLDYFEYASDNDAQSAYVSNGAVLATGGTITDVAGDKVHTFTSNGTFTPSAAMNVKVLVIGGGAGGGGLTSNTPGSGGGGAGGYLYNDSYAVTAQAYSVTVGQKGDGSVGNGHGGNGGNSIFGTMISVGGGGGGFWGPPEDASSRDGYSGGSGGGAGGSNQSATGGTGTGGQGNNGGSTSGSEGAGGGGGSGGAGAGNSSSNGGAGGSGTANSISGTSVIYSAGGGGGGKNSGTGGAGGSAGAGAGGSGGSNGYSATVYGCGGGGASGGTYNGGNGADGVVIIRYTPIYNLQCYSEASIKQQGSYSLKGIAVITDSLNKTLTRTIGSPINLSNYSTLKFDIRSSRTGSNIKIGIHDSGGTTTEITPNITDANTWQTVNLDISGVSNANKDAIDSIIITIVNADAENTFYIDNFYAEAIIYNMTLISNEVVAEEVPSQARIVLFEEDIDSITLNTDLKAYASRDDGTTWTQLTLTDEGDYETNKRVLSAISTNIASQPSGSNMRIKLTTHNNKNLKIHGQALQWA